MGPPGSGRATYAKIIAQQFGVVHISTKDILMDEVHRKTQIGEIVSEYFN